MRGTTSIEGWRLCGSPELFAEVRADLETAARERRTERGPRRLGADDAYFKGSALGGRSGLRHGIRRALGLGLPRLCEFQNLDWLREHGFLAARPLLAGALLAGSIPRYQFLFTVFVENAPTLEQRMRAPSASGRAPLLEALARDVARLHALGFVHRDLFTRNLLCPSAEQPRSVFLDAWRGGPRRGWRGPNHDLGCLLLDLAGMCEREEQRFFLSRYREESARSGRALSGAWERRVERARAALYRRESRRRADLVETWTFPSA